MLPTAVLSCTLNAGGGFVARVTPPLPARHPLLLIHLCISDCLPSVETHVLAPVTAPPGDGCSLLNATHIIHSHPTYLISDLLASQWRIHVKQANGDENDEEFKFVDRRRHEMYRQHQIIRNQRLEAEGIKTGGFKCANCGKMYNQQASLWRHSKYECGKGPQFQCPYCSLKVTQKCYMRKHILRRHSDRVFAFSTC